jgi:hypothetical protein
MWGEGDGGVTAFTERRAENPKSPRATADAGEGRSGYSREVLTKQYFSVKYPPQ